METLPNWFWILFCLFLLITLVSAIYSSFRAKLIYWAYATIILSLLVPVMGIIFAAQRTGDLNEWEYLISRLGDGDIWAVFISLFLLYFVVWWYLFLKEDKYILLLIRKLRDSEKIKGKIKQISMKLFPNRKDE